MAPDLNYFILEFLSYIFLVPFVSVFYWVFDDILCSFKNKILNRKAGVNRKINLSLTVNEIYLIQKSLCVRANIMDDYSSYKAHELVDKLSQELIDNKVPVDLKKLGYCDFDDVI